MLSGLLEQQFEMNAFERRSTQQERRKCCRILPTQVRHYVFVVDWEVGNPGCRMLT